MSENIEITPIATPLQDLDKLKMAEIRFDCTVKMFDVGYKTTNTFLNQKHHSPQWFALTLNLTHEAIHFGDERTIGRAVKEAYKQLKEVIDRYEK